VKYTLSGGKEEEKWKDTDCHSDQEWKANRPEQEDEMPHGKYRLVSATLNADFRCPTGNHSLQDKTKIKYSKDDA
jgi:hypothetical protein